MSACGCSKPLGAQNGRSAGHGRPARGEPVAAAVVASSRIARCHILVDRCAGAGGAWSGDGEPWRAIALATAGCALPAPCAGRRAARPLPYRSGPRLLPIPHLQGHALPLPAVPGEGTPGSTRIPVPHSPDGMVPRPVAGVREPPGSTPKFGCVCPFGAASGPGALGLF